MGKLPPLGKLRLFLGRTTRVLVDNKNCSFPSELRKGCRGVGVGCRKESCLLPSLLPVSFPLALEHLTAKINANCRYQIENCKSIDFIRIILMTS